MLVGPKIIGNYLKGRATESNQPAVAETTIIPSFLVEASRTAFPSPIGFGGITLLPTEEATVTATVPSPTMTPITTTPSPAAVVYTLLVMTRNDESLVIANRSKVSFPLTGLYLEGEDDRILSGAAWGIEILQRGECVHAIKDKGRTKLPGIECQQVGESLPREGKERFWKEGFDIYYDREKVGTCEVHDGENSCWVIFSHHD